MAAGEYFGALLKAGIEIYDYQPGMIHSKILLIDHDVAVIDSTNLDRRSIVLNGELNLVVFDVGLATALAIEFDADIILSNKVDLVAWNQRSHWERVIENLARSLEKQE